MAIHRPAVTGTEKAIAPSWQYASVMVLTMVAILGVGVIVLGLPIHATMLCVLLVLIAMAILIGYSYKQVQNFAFDTVRRAMEPIFILIAVGAMIGAWISSGTVPSLIVLGFQALSPSYFLVGTLLICVIISLVTGTSWGTIGTVGVALIAVASGMGVPLEAAAGAIICGAFFGDKMSPLSDSTNLAAGLAETDLMGHIRHMLWTTVPAFLITAGIFAAMDFTRDSSGEAARSAELIVSNLHAQFTISPWNLIPVIVVVTLLVMRQPPFTSIAVGALAAVPISVAVQHRDLADAIGAMHGGYLSESGNELLDDLLTAGGIADMAATVALMILAVAVGGVLEGSGALKSLLNRFIAVMNTGRRVVVATIFVTLFSNMATASNSPAHVVSASLMRPLFDKYNLHRKNLSRILEDAATVTSPIIPWNTAAVFTVGVLGVSTLAYLPYTFLSVLVPVISLVYGLTGFTIVKADASKTANTTESKAVGSNNAS